MGRTKKQGTIPGTDKDRDKTLDRMIEEAVELTDNWLQIGEDMRGKRAKVLEYMKEHGMTEYRAIDLDPVRVVRVVHTDEKVTIQKEKSEASTSPNGRPAGLDVTLDG
jgi:hypothetical protein